MGLMGTHADRAVCERSPSARTRRSCRWLTNGDSGGTICPNSLQEFRTLHPMRWKTFIFTTKPATVLDGIHLEGAAYAGLDLRSPPRQLAAVEGHTDATDFHDAAADVAEFWRVLAQATTRCMPAHRPWSRVFLDFRPESGTVAASLRDASDEMRRIPIVVSLILPFIERESGDLPEPDDDEAAFDAGIAAIREKTRDALVAGAAEPSARTALERLCAEHRITIDLEWRRNEPTHRIAGQ